MDCLNCHAEMTTYDVVTRKDHVTYNACDQCGSLWLDRGELDKLAFRSEGSIEYCEEAEAVVPEARAMPCPRCDDAALSRVKFLGSDDITLHYCGSCQGFWLNGGELDLVNGKIAKIMPVTGHGFSDFVNNVHVPYWYKRTKQRSSETDFVVETMPIAGAEFKSATADQCPACDGTLNVYRIFGHDFKGCPKCKGIWLIQDELRKLKNKEDGGALRWLNDEIENIDKTAAVASPRVCPQDKTATVMTVLFGHSSVLIDWCRTCHGIWLDRNEFQTIVDYLKAELDAMPSGEIGQHLVADVERAVTGGPEGRLAEVADAKAAWSALLNAKIFEHPELFNRIMYSGLPR
ncbi:MAG TPA: zf-TFIIB domain-containing protein [Vicinamibacterales bacterium]|jgi:Zn-finger nucleic acid-binding protein|nr:zf-TFIIB domain-containing protein [Vicinamibacterales bacterium]